jgi:pyrimidine operon attenuation protein/uracil phosphoribosyltransferase
VPTRPDPAGSAGHASPATAFPESGQSPDPQLPSPLAAVPAVRELLGSPEIARTIDRIAHQILERNGDDVPVLLGIPTRGTVLARRLAERLSLFSGGPVPVGSLDITLYRDDLRRRGPRALEETFIPAGGIDERIVVLVDDVLFSGRTVRAALDALRDHGRPAVVQLAVLVDRGHRQLPLRADYVGKNIPTALADTVAVRVIELDGVDGVELRRAP